jgi:hypothetical protein
LPCKEKRWLAGRDGVKGYGEGADEGEKLRTERETPFGKLSGVQGRFCPLRSHAVSRWQIVSDQIAFG